MALENDHQGAAGPESREPTLADLRELCHLMKSACGVDYAQAVGHIDYR